MSSPSLSGSVSLANLRLIAQSGTVKTAEAELKGFGRSEHKYRVTHDTQNHTLVVTRLYSFGIVATRVSLDYQPGWLRQHKTSQWIVKLLLTRGAAIPDEDKAKILVQPALETHSIRLLDWMSDGELTGELPRLGVSCQQQPTGEALTSQRTQVVFDAMLAYDSTQACKILRKKSAEFQVSVLKHQFHEQNQEEIHRRSLSRCLLEQDEIQVQELFQVLLAEVKKDFDNHLILAGIVKAFIASDPALLAQKLQTMTFKVFSFVLPSASIPPQPEGLSKFYSELCKVTEHQQNIRLAQRAVVDFASERELTAYQHNDGISHSDYKFLGDFINTDPIRVLLLNQSSNCLYAMLKARCSFWGLQLHQENKIITATCARGFDEQWCILTSCLNADGALSPFYTRLLDNLLAEEAPEFPRICASLFADNNFDLFWALYGKNPSRAFAFLKAQPQAVQARCLEPVLLTAEASSEKYNFARQVMLSSKWAAFSFISKINNSYDSIRRNLIVLIEKDIDFAIKCLSTQDAGMQVSTIISVIEGTVNLRGNTMAFVRTMLGRGNHQFEDVYGYLSHNEKFNTIIGKLIDTDPAFASTILLNLDCHAQTQWIVHVIDSGKIKHDTQVCLATLLSRENDKLLALRQQLIATKLLEQVEAITTSSNV